GKAAAAGPPIALRAVGPPLAIGWGPVRAKGGRAMGASSWRFVAATACAAAVACARGSDPTLPTGGGQDAGVDAGTDDGGTHAGTSDGGTDGGTLDGGIDGGITFGGPGPWPMTNVTYGQKDGIQETPVVGMSTDEN